MKKSCLLVFLLLASAAVFAQVISYDLPLLTVSGQKGNFSRIVFEFRKTGKSVPLRMLISDDSPNGSGITIRASLWQAAMTAAMQKNNLMTGSRITVEFSGMVDGPSAGGVLCLAIMSALDGKEFPSDFAMTGTIMPDGTVGVVGSVALKMRAAAAAGIKRVCIPAFLRFEKQRDGAMIDLFSEAEKLNISVHPVEHISEAYAILHNLPAKSTAVPEAREVCRISGRMEKEIIRQCRQYFAKVREFIDKTEKSEIDEIKKVPGFVDMMFPDKAEQLFISGKLFGALDKISSNYVFWTARNNLYEFTQDLLQKEPQLFKDLDSGERLRQVNALSKYNDIYRKMLSNMISSVKSGNMFLTPDGNPETISEISAQFKNPMEKIGYSGAMQFFFEYNMAFDSAGLKKLCDDKKLTQEEFMEKISAVAGDIDFKMLLYFGSDNAPEINRQIYAGLASKMPQIKGNSHLKEVELLFYNAWMTTNNSVESSVVGDLSDDLNSSAAKIRTAMANTDMECSAYYQGRDVLHSIHRSGQLNFHRNEYAYHTVASTFASIDMLSRASAILIKYGPELDARGQDGKFIYTNTAFLHYLIRTARNQALHSIAECRRLHIPCVKAIMDFELAEISREDNSSDKIHDVLQQYWKANLEAKALVLGFGK